MSNTTEIVINEHGQESHESWVSLRANRAQVSPPGVHLFDSELRHQEIVVVSVHRCTRKRDLNRDWIHEEALLMELRLSTVQWGAFVSSFGDSSARPATLTFLVGEGEVSQAPFDPRTAHTLNEVRSAANEGVAGINEAFEAVDEAFERKAGRRELRDLLTDLRHRIGNAPANLTFAAESLTEHVENVVTKARADIEAMAAHAAQRGIAAPDSSEALALDPAVEDAEVIDTTGEEQ